MIEFWMRAYRAAKPGIATIVVAVGRQYSLGLQAALRGRSAEWLCPHGTRGAFYPMAYDDEAGRPLPLALRSASEVDGLLVHGLKSYWRCGCELVNVESSYGEVR